MITMHASSKAFVQNGKLAYLPMITARGEKGRMIGSKCPQGEAREFRTFTTSDAAREAAYEAAKRCAADYPHILCVA
jgi:hypothetical protein